MPPAFAILNMNGTPVTTVTKEQFAGRLKKLGLKGFLNGRVNPDDLRVGRFQIDEKTGFVWIKVDHPDGAVTRLCLHRDFHHPKRISIQIEGSRRGATNPRARSKRTR